MKNGKKIVLALLLVLTMSIGLLSGCGSTDSSKKETTATAEATSSTDSATMPEVTWATEPKEGDAIDEEVDVTVTFNNDEIEVTGDNAKSMTSVKDTTLTITKAGTYVISGTLKDGRIVVDTEDEEKVKIILNGVMLSNDSTSAVYVVSAPKEVILSANKNSVNIISDGEEYDESDESGAAIYAKDDLQLSGKGSLYVTGNYKKGIVSKDDLHIKNLSLYVKADDDAIRGKDSVSVENAYIYAEAEQDGIRSSNETDTEKGDIEITDSEIYLTVKQDGIQSVRNLTLTNTKAVIDAQGEETKSTETKSSETKSSETKSTENKSTDTAKESSTESSSGSDSSSTTGDLGELKSQGGMGQKPGNGEKPSGGGGPKNGEKPDDSQMPQNGEKPDDSQMPENGEKPEDGQMPEGNQNAEGGQDNPMAEFDSQGTSSQGLQAVGTMTVTGGNITILDSTEGLEASKIVVEDATFHITATDDGINAATDDSSVTPTFIMNSGYIVISAEGDGVDTNGDATIKGGTLLIYGPTNGGNGALDYDSGFKVEEGATVLAVGSSGMAQGFSESSASLEFTCDVEAGDIMSIQDSDGNVVCTFEAPKNYQCVVFTSPDITKGEEYTVYTGGSVDGDNTDGIYEDGSYKGGSTIGTVTAK
ncbi:MAG: carbohydrate-binding domain-containing protein [Lachnospiraceae bacterium]|nr:carbohydrate-binding domain-containing protein [Lachnospiraceae bacterium]